jgi:hypothetical protein
LKHKSPFFPHVLKIPYLVFLLFDSLLKEYIVLSDKLELILKLEITSTVQGRIFCIHG